MFMCKFLVMLVVIPPGCPFLLLPFFGTVFVCEHLVVLVILPSWPFLLLLFFGNGKKRAFPESSWLIVVDGSASEGAIFLLLAMPLGDDAGTSGR